MIWKHSRLRYYILNAIWNYKFWLFAEKIYKEYSYETIDNELNLENMDITGKIKFNKKKVFKKRFVGYMFQNGMYLDNPGFKHTVDKETWNAWKLKGLIKK
jgi:hypothetical protein